MQKKLGPFSIAMMNIVTVASLRNLTISALLGASLIFYYGLVALLFFIPIALVCMDFVVHFPKGGGVYLWIKEAFGKKAGFVAIWLQWLENVVYYPTLLSFIGGTLLSLFYPELGSNQFVMFGIVLAIFWVFTLVNLLGIEATAWISNIGGLLGTIFPAAFIVVLGISWFFSGQPLNISFGQFELPSLGLEQLALLGGMALSFGGMEVSEVHVEDVDQPKRSYPLAIGISTIAILAIYVCGSLAIAMVLPPERINLVAGLIETFRLILTQYNLGFLVPIVGLCMIGGAMATLSTWIVGPTRGILVAAQDGHLPKAFEKTNSHKMPSTLLITQACIVTLLSSAFLFMPSINSSFWLLTILAVQYYLIMYIMLFAAAIALQIRDNIFPKRIWTVSIVGMLSCLGIFVLDFFPPETIGVGDIWVFELSLVIGILIGIGAALIPHKTKD